MPACWLAGYFVKLFSASLCGDNPSLSVVNSLDIYKEEERYTPLGADAAINYGYKDLRLRNPYPFAIKYSFIVKDDELSCRIFMEDKVFPNKVQFLRQTADEKEMVQTIIIDPDGNKTELAISEYAKY